MHHAVYINKMAKMQVPCSLPQVSHDVCSVVKPTLNSDWKVTGFSVTYSLEYLPALIVTRRSFSETSEKQNLKRLVC